MNAPAPADLEQIRNVLESELAAWQAMLARLDELERRLEYLDDRLREVEQ